MRFCLSSVNPYPSPAVNLELLSFITTAKFSLIFLSSFNSKPDLL